MQDNEVSLEQLKSVYKAHTEAYLDFNMALINILSNQKEIINKVESLKVLSDEEFKNLSKAMNPNNLDIIELNKKIQQLEKEKLNEKLFRLVFKKNKLLYLINEKNINPIF